MTETIGYEVVQELEEAEVRQYPSIILATVSGRSDNVAFELLFDYISGNNEAKVRIPMTAPVFSASGRSEKIAMTTPVISGMGAFSFVLPRSYKMDTVPEPLDRNVELTLVPQRKVAVLRFRGRTSEPMVRRKIAQLLAEIERAGMEVRGEPFLMRYNPPFTPGFLRRNEIGAEVL